MAGIVINGVTIKKPGVYSIADVSAMVAPNPNANGIIAAIGTCRGGKPFEVYHFTSPREMLATLKQGELADCIGLMYSPSGTGGGAYDVLAIRVVGDGYSQASVTLNAGGSQPTLKITALDYGNIGNFIRVGVYDGTSSGKKITIHDYYNNIPVEVFDNLKDAFSIQYTGTADTAKLTITRTNNVATEIACVVEDHPEEGFVFDLTSNDYRTVGQLVSAINALPNYTCALSPYIPAGDLPTSYLDAVADQDIKTSAYTATAKLGTIIYALEKSKIVRASKATASATLPPANTDEVPLSGGSEGAAPDVNDYNRALALLEGYDCRFIVVTSTDSEIQSAVMAHVNSMSSVRHRKERRAIFGLDPSSGAADYKARAMALNSHRAILVGPAIKKSINVVLTSLPGYYLAAITAGTLVGMDVKDNLTFKPVAIEGLTQNFTQAEIDDLISSGVTVVEYDVRKGYRYVRGVTTHLSDQNLAKIEINCAEVIDLLTQDIRTTLEDRYIGKPMYYGIDKAIRDTVISILERWSKNGRLVGSDTIPAYRNVNVILENGVAIVSFEASPVIPLNYIVVEETFSPAYGWTSAVSI